MLLYKNKQLDEEVYCYCVIYQELEEKVYIDYGRAIPKRKIIAIVDNEEVAKHFCKINQGRYQYAYYRTDNDEAIYYYVV